MFDPLHKKYWAQQKKEEKKMDIRASERWERWERVPSQFEILAATFG